MKSIHKEQESMPMSSRTALMLWFSSQQSLPYRFRKSIVKKCAPELLKDNSFTVDFYGMRFSGNAGDYISRMVYFCGGYERYMLHFLRDYISHFDPKSSIFVDVGANIGNHSLYMSQYCSEVHAFEPFERVREQLEKNICSNDISNIFVYPEGLAEEDATIPFYAPPASNLGAGSFSKNHYVGNEYICDLKVVSGDEEFKKRNIKGLDILKLDVEGFEKQALHGLRRTIGQFRPLIALELSDTARDFFGDYSSFSSSFPNDYAFYRFSVANRDNGRYKLSPFEYTKHYKRKDVIACPVEKISMLPFKGKE